LSCKSSAQSDLNLRGQLLYSRQDKLLFFLGQSFPSSDTIPVSMVESRSTSEANKGALKRNSTKRMAKRSSLNRDSISATSAEVKSMLELADTIPAPVLEDDGDSSPSAADVAESAAGLAGNLSDSSPRAATTSRPSIVIPPLVGSPTRQEEDDNTPIEDVLRRIFTEILGIALKTAYDDQFLECMYKLKKNCISTQGLLFRLPSARAIEKLGLPILIESELINLYSLRSHFEEPVFSRFTPTQEKSTSADSGGVTEAAGSPKSHQKSAILGITDDMRAVIKQTWSDISTARTNGSHLNQFFECVLSVLQPNFLPLRSSSVSAI
jgi:hypothetical protein